MSERSADESKVTSCRVFPVSTTRISLELLLFGEVFGMGVGSSSLSNQSLDLVDEDAGLTGGMVTVGVVDPVMVGGTVTVEVISGAAVISSSSLSQKAVGLTLVSSSSSKKLTFRANMTVLLSGLYSLN